MKYNIPFIKPRFPDQALIAADYTKIHESNWYTNFGAFERQFRQEISKFLGEDIGVSTVANATLGLLLAVEATIGKGDGSKYVLMPSFTFVAGAQALLWCGYKPYFIDIEPKSLQMDIALVRRVIASRHHAIAGILFCNSFGIGAPGITDWEDLAKEAHLPLLIDSAAGFGSKYEDGNHVGTHGDCEVFSFHATKPFAVGEGGAVVSRHPDIIETVQRLQNFGFDKHRESSGLGINAKLQEINAAIGLRQLEDFSSRLISRQNSYLSYRRDLEEGFNFPDNAERSSLCFMTAVSKKRGRRDAALQHLASVGISAQAYYYPPVHKQSYFRLNPGLWEADQLTVTEDVSENILSLPIHDNMPEETIADVTKTLTEAYE